MPDCRYRSRRTQRRRFRKRARAPAVVITELRLPGEDRFALVERLGGRRDPRHIPIGIVSGYMSTRLAEGVRALNARVVLMKPCPLDRLLAEVLAAIEEPGTELVHV